MGTIKASLPVISISFLAVIFGWLRAVGVLNEQLKQYEADKVAAAAAAAAEASGPATAAAAAVTAATAAAAAEVAVVSSGSAAALAVGAEPTQANGKLTGHGHADVAGGHGHADVAGVNGESSGVPVRRSAGIEA